MNKASSVADQDENLYRN